MDRYTERRVERILKWEIFDTFLMRVKTLDRRDYIIRNWGEEEEEDWRVNFQKLEIVFADGK